MVDIAVDCDAGIIATGDPVQGYLEVTGLIQQEKITAAIKQGERRNSGVDGTMLQNGLPQAIRSQGRARIPG